MMATCCKRCIGISLHTLVLTLLFGITFANADDISSEDTVESTDVYADDEYTDDSSDDYADDAAAEYVDEDTESYEEDEEVEEGPGFFRKAWDVAVLRPMNFVRLTAGCVIMAPVAILALPGGIDNVQNMADYFVDQPYWDTFGRPLGKF